MRKIFIACTIVLVCLSVMAGLFLGRVGANGTLTGPESKFATCRIQNNTSVLTANSWGNDEYAPAWLETTPLDCGWQLVSHFNPTQDTLFLNN